MLAFWQGEAGLEYEGPLPIRRGLIQHRHRAGGSIVKINLRDAPPPQTPPSGYSELLIARPGLDQPRALTDPDGNRLCLWPQGRDSVEQIAVRLKVRDLARHREFYSRVLGLEECPPTPSGEVVFAAGASRVWLEQSADAPDDAAFEGFGWRYSTFQVFRVDAIHAAVLATGGREAMTPTTLGDTARISMVRDPDGNWIELSQRRSIVGSLD